MKSLWTSSFKLFTLFLLALPLALIMSCGSSGDDDDDIPPATVDIDDANDIAEALSVFGATSVDGDPPAPSTDPAAPKIDDDLASLVASDNGGVTLDLGVQSGEVSGFYFQVEGSDSYLDIPYTGAGGRVLQDEVGFDIDFDERFPPGEFCAEVCVYDDDARVSNIQRVCVEIVERGGDGSEFLVGDWSLVSYTEFDDQREIRGEVGELVDDVWVADIYCSDDQETVDFEVNTQVRTDYLNVSFKSDGTVTLMGSEYEKRIDWERSDCEVVYIEETDTFSEAGVWSYNASTKVLVMVLEDVDDGDRDVIEVSVSLVDGELVVSEDNGSFIFAKS